MQRQSASARQNYNCSSSKNNNSSSSNYNNSARCSNSNCAVSTALSTPAATTAPPKRPLPLAAAALPPPPQTGPPADLSVPAVHRPTEASRARRLGLRREVSPTQPVYRPTSVLRTCLPLQHPRTDRRGLLFVVQPTESTGAKRLVPALRRPCRRCSPRRGRVTGHIRHPLWRRGSAPHAVVPKPPKPPKLQLMGPVSHTPPQPQQTPAACLISRISVLS